MDHIINLQTVPLNILIIFLSNILLFSAPLFDVKSYRAVKKKVAIYLAQDLGWLKEVKIYHFFSIIYRSFSTSTKTRTVKTAQPAKPNWNSNEQTFTGRNWVWHLERKYEQKYKKYTRSY